MSKYFISFFIMINFSAFASQKDYIQSLSILDAHLSEHPHDALCKLQKLMIESPDSRFLQKERGANTKNTMRSKVTELAKAKFLQFDQELSWCLNPTQDQKDKLEDIKDDHHKGCIAAKGFLELIEGLPLEDYRILPRLNRSSIIQDETKTEKEIEEFVAYPSPTDSYINFNCYIDEAEFSSIEIYDFTGKIILTIQPDKSGFAYTDMLSFSNGIYLAVLKSNGLIRGQTKFILNK